MAAAAILAFAGTAGCGGEETEDKATSATATAEGDQPAVARVETTIEIAEFLYEPEDATVMVGATVNWVNQDKATHTATADDSSFDTGDLGQGDEADATFDEPGSYSYYCRFHPFMKGTVDVQ